MDLCDIRVVRSLLSRHGVRLSKSLGQNFLIDPEVPAAIAEASGADSGTGVLEIGPGVGCLTAQLALRAARVTAVELDQTLLPVLAETMAPYPNVEILPGDILKTDLSRLVREHFAGLTPLVCASLPYRITTPVMTRLIESRLFARITVMIQREVALRVCAAPGTPDYGAFSVFCQYYTCPEILFSVPPESFLPAPKVTSAVVRLTPRQSPPADIADETLFFQVVRASFAQRRKTLRNALSPAFPSLTREDLGQCLADCGLGENVRGEQLGIPEFAALAERIRKFRG